MAEMTVNLTCEESVHFLVREIFRETSLTRDYLNQRTLGV